MKGYKLVLAFLVLLPLVSAQYWFQSGSRGGHSTEFNNGAMVTIQTLTSQNTKSGSVAYWVGEDLQNGAFLQAGYVIENQSGRYPSYCNASGCGNYEYISAGSPEWFYEYFPPGSSNMFLGAIGPNASAGSNNTLHTYGFYSNGTRWYFTMDGHTLGDVNLGTNTSGYNDAVAFGELANSSNTATWLFPVAFYNLSIYRFGRFVPSPTGYSYIGYGVGSLSDLQNPYGVREIGSRSNAFEIGSGIPRLPNNYPLWQNSYTLTIVSQYGNLSSSVGYIASSAVPISAPKYIYLNSTAREAFVGWSGYGAISYSGPSNFSTVQLYGNITEQAQWQLQYFVNVTSQFGTVHGTGWYPANSTMFYSIGQNMIYNGNGSRVVFSGWSTGPVSQSSSVKVSSPMSVQALWVHEYLVNASSQYGNTSGSGWYQSNSTASISVLTPYKNESATERLAFYSWSDGNKSANYAFTVNGPYRLEASFRNQYFVSLYGIDQYGNPVNASTFYLTGTAPGKELYLYGGEPYTVTGALYKGTNLTVNRQLVVNSSGRVSVALPLYDVHISASDVFGLPVAVPVILTIENGTTLDILLNGNGSSGTTLHDVPYGRLVASTDYLGFQLSSSVEYGQPVHLTVLSYLDLAVFAAVVVLAIVIYFIASRHVLGGHNQ